jgi:hypothetical protein
LLSEQCEDWTFNFLWSIQYKTLLRSGAHWQKNQYSLPALLIFPYIFSKPVHYEFFFFGLQKSKKKINQKPYWKAMFGDITHFYVVQIAIATCVSQVAFVTHIFNSTNLMFNCIAILIISWCKTLMRTWFELEMVYLLL